jgi:hypothetical protein
MEQIKLWLDDVRPAPKGWYHAHNAAEAKHAFQKYDVTEASLDHDLGNCEHCDEIQCHHTCECPCHENGYHVAKWMAANNIWPVNGTACHSANPVGKVNILSVVNRYGIPK